MVSPIVKITSSLLALLATLPLSGCGDEPHRPDQSLRFTAIPDRDATLLRERYAPVATYLSRQLGIPVEYVHSSRYADAVEHFKNGDVQLAWFGGLTGVQVRHAVAGAQAIAQGEADPKFYSYFIAHTDADIEPSVGFPTGLAGKKFTFGSPDSTSGRLMPEHFIRKYSGQSPKQLFGHDNHYSGDHDRTCELVESGQFQVGAVNYKTYDQRVASGKTDPTVCRVVWKSDLYADYNFTAHPQLESSFGTGFTARLQRALLDMDPELAQNFDRQRFVAADNSDFDAIEKLATELGFVRQ